MASDYRSQLTVEQDCHRQLLLPIAAAFVFLAVEPFGLVPYETHKVGLLMGALTVGGILAGRALAKEPALANLMRWVWQVAAHIVWLLCTNEAHSVLLDLLSVFVIPFAFVITASRDGGPLLVLYMAAHFAATLLHFRGRIAEDGWQWLLALVIGDFMCYVVHEQRSHVTISRSKSKSLDSANQVVQQLLATVCDGSLLLQADGTVLGADEKASDLLEMDEAIPDSAKRDPSIPRVGKVLEGVVEGGHLVSGTRMLQPRRPCGEGFKVEAYIISCPLGPEDAHSLVSTVDISSLASVGSVYLCALRLVENSTMPVDTRRSESSARSLDDEGEVLMDGAAEGFVDDQRRGSLKVIRPMSNVASDTGMTQATEAHSGLRQTRPGIDLSAVQAVALGVGAYTKLGVVGRGAQGSVWKVMSQDGTIYAQKEIALKGMLWARDFPKRLRDTDREVRALKGLAWASCVVVPIVDCWIQQDFEASCIVMEWLPKNMSDVLKERRTRDLGPVPSLQVAEWVAHLSVGLVAIHSAGFLHRDIKPANILLDDKLKCKISDLGVSRALHSITTPSKEQENGQEDSIVSFGEDSLVSGSILSGYTVSPGTMAYTSPEARETGKYGCSTDVFSLGVVLLEILMLKPPAEPRLGHRIAKEQACDAAQAFLASLAASGGVDRRREELTLLCVQMLRPDAEERPMPREIALNEVVRPYTQELMEKCERFRSLLNPEEDLGDTATGPRPREGGRRRKVPR